MSATILIFMLEERKKKKKEFNFYRRFYWKFKASCDKNLFYIFHVKTSGFSNQCSRTKEQLSIRKNITDSKFDTQLNAIKIIKRVIACSFAGQVSFQVPALFLTSAF